jgi:hypothetical protein
MPSALTVNTGTSGFTIVARPVAALDASGEAALTTLEQVSVSVSYDDLYLATLNATEAKKLLDSFTLDGSGSTFACTLTNSTNFKEVLTEAMARAEGSTYASANSTPTHVVGNTLQQNLIVEILAMFNSIYADSLPNILQSEWDIYNNVGYEAGAIDMAAKLIPAEAEILAQQIPEANYVSYMKGGTGEDKEDLTTHALPLVGGDKIVFVFYLSEAAVARVNKKTAGSLADNGTGASAGGTGGVTTNPNPVAAPGAGQVVTNAGPYGNEQQAVTYASNTRTVAFQLTMAAQGTELNLKA